MFGAHVHHILSKHGVLILPMHCTPTPPRPQAVVYGERSRLPCPERDPGFGSKLWALRRRVVSRNLPPEPNPLNLNCTLAIYCAWITDRPLSLTKVDVVG